MRKVFIPQSQFVSLKIYSGADSRSDEVFKCHQPNFTISN